MKDNCFTKCYCFLSNLPMNQPEVYIYPLSFEFDSYLPPHPTPLGWYRAPVWVSWALQQIHLSAIYFTYGNVSFPVTLSIRLTLSSPVPMSTSLFSVSASPFSWVTQSYLTLCEPTDCSTPGFPVHHQLLELAQTHVHWVGYARLAQMKESSSWKMLTKFSSVALVTTHTHTHTLTPEGWDCVLLQEI